MPTLSQVHNRLSAKLAELDARFVRGEGHLQIHLKPQEYLMLTSANCPAGPLTTKRQKVLANPQVTHVIVTIDEAEQLLEATGSIASASVVAQESHVASEDAAAEAIGD